VGGQGCGKLVEDCPREIDGIGVELSGRVNLDLLYQHSNGRNANDSALDLFGILVGRHDPTKHDDSFHHLNDHVAGVSAAEVASEPPAGAPRLMTTRTVYL